MSLKVDPFQRLKIVLNSDGTITRNLEDPRTPPAPDPTLPIPVLTQDAPINNSNNTFARIFLPRNKALNVSSTKLPLIVHFHGGGFIYFSAASDIVQHSCANLANDTNSIVVSIEYRLAPEHRLPAAYDDAVEALHWIKSKSNDWLKNHADYSNCYLLGTSAGANIAYHAGLRVAAGITVDGNYIAPLKIKGLIMCQPFFGSTKRVGSEIRLVDDAVLAPHVSDLLWELSLPLGVDRDHEYCNPTVGDGLAILEKVRELAWRVLVSGCDGDPLVDHQRALARLMEEKGVTVLTRFNPGGYHGDRGHIKEVYHSVKHFIASSSS